MVKTDYQGQRLSTPTNKRFLSINTTMILAGLVLVGSVGGSTYYIQDSLKKFRVGGTAYNWIVADKDLIADLIPPPLLPLEAFSLVHAGRDTGGGIDANRLKQLETDFETRLAHWTNEFVDADLGQSPEWVAFRNEIEKRGREFFVTLNAAIIPQIKANSPTVDAEIEKLTLRFVEFVNYVSANHQFLIERSNELQGTTLANSDSTLWAVRIIGLLTCLLSAVFVLAGQRYVVRGISNISASMSQLADGDLETQVPYQGRRDEIGQMAGAVNVFKRQAAEVRDNQEANEKVIRALSAGLENMANGNLSYRIQEPFGDALDALRLSFNESMSGLQEAISTVKNGADGIRSGTEEIAQASDDLSRRTENQAANLEQTAAAVAEITNKVKQTASGAVHARGVVESTKSEADRSGEVVQKAVTAMQQIEQSSQKITQIISVIDEIAFQTNLLALNAGVEAARAGEAGRGFAVVASEVRALAQRSADAAREIKQLLSTSQDAVSQGVNLVAETGKSLSAIISRVAEINSIVGEIASSAEQQAAGLQEVNTAVDQMDQVTQQNASMVEETTAATRTLTQQSVELARLVSRFTTATSSVIANTQKRALHGDAAKQAGHSPAPRAKRVAASNDPEWQEF